MKTSTVLILLALALPSTAIGQTPPPPAPAPAPPPPPPGPILRHDLRQGPLDSDELNNNQRGPLAGQSRERVILANRLARMANGGDCPGAIRAAWDAGDRGLAQRLFEACRRPDA